MKRFISCFVFIFLIIFIFTTYPSTAAVSVLGNLGRELQMQSGDKREGTILVKNSGETAASVRVYQTDYSYSANGRSQYGQPGQMNRSNADWITIYPKYLTVQPNSTAIVNYTIQVPENEELTGTYWSMIMVEPIVSDKVPDIKKEEGKVKIGIRAVVRYGIQIATNISESGKKKIEIIDKELNQNEDDSYTLSLDIKNTGERLIKPNVWTELYNEKGTLAEKVEGKKVKLYPGTSKRVKIKLKDIPAGNYKALVIMDNGDDNIWGAKYKINLN